MNPNERWLGLAVNLVLRKGVPYKEHQPDSFSQY